MRTVGWMVALGMLAGCERTVADDGECVAWYDRCGGCAQQCTATWDVDPAADACDIDCLESDGYPPLPACVADAGTCVFAD